MLPNEIFALACRAYYEEQGLIVDKRNGEFAHCPYPKGMGETGYYLLWEHHQHQGLLQSRDVGRRCFFTPDARKWLLSADYFPDNYFELWGIYEEFSKPSPQCYAPETNKKRVETFTKRGCGRLEHCHTPEAMKKMVETRRKNGVYDRGIDYVSPEKRRKVTELNRKQVEITFPDGRIGVFHSLTFASIFLNVPSSTIRSWIKKKAPVEKGDRKGYSASYL